MVAFCETFGEVKSGATTRTNRIVPAYDARGNMTTVPKPTDLDSTYTCTYDSWNRLAEVKSGETTIAKYEYDGVNRRVKKHIDTTAEPNGVDTYRHFYYNNAWQIVETRVTTSDPDTAPDTLDPEYQYVWSLRYIDAPILRDENQNSDGDCTDEEGDQRLYYLTDANMNVTCIVDISGDAIERYMYDPYGNVTILDGTTDSQTDWATDANQLSDVDNVILFCGYFRDTETSLYHVRHRTYHPHLGRWLQRDPLSYIDGMSLYEYVASDPLSGLDPAGLESVEEWIKLRVLIPLGYIVPASECVTACEALPDIAIIMIGAALKRRAIELAFEGRDPERDPVYLALKAALGYDLSPEEEQRIRDHYGIPSPKPGDPNECTTHPSPPPPRPPGQKPTPPPDTQPAPPKPKPIPPPGVGPMPWPWPIRPLPWPWPPRPQKPEPPQPPLPSKPDPGPSPGPGGGCTVTCRDLCCRPEGTMIMDGPCATIIADGKGGTIVKKKGGPGCP